MSNNEELYPNSQLNELKAEESHKSSEDKPSPQLSLQLNKQTIEMTKSENETQKTSPIDEKPSSPRTPGSSKIRNIVEKFEGKVDTEDITGTYRKKPTKPEWMRLFSRPTSGQPSSPVSPPPFQNYGECAVQLYKSDGGGKYSLDMEAVTHVFSKVADKLIAVYTISGKFRSGKSFMLAQLLKYLKFGDQLNWIDIQTDESFRYKNSAERVTTGIWIWPQPIIKKTPHGREVAVFLMDTQGWHDEYATAQDNALIFAYSAVLSSVQIFNADKRIGEDDLNYFQSFSTTAKLIDAKNRDQPFQKLVFLIRDWQFPDDFPYGYYDDHTSINGKNYKISKINPQGDQSTDARSVREIILSTYMDISAYLMPYPGQWIQNDKFNSETSDPLFLINLTEFITGLFSSHAIVPKRIGGKLVTGKDLIASAHLWAKEFKYVPKTISKSIPFTPSPLDESYYLLAYQTSLDYFDEKIKKKLNECRTLEDFEDVGMEKSEIIGICSKIFESSKKMSDEKLRKKYEIKLGDDLNERNAIYTNIIEKNIELKELELDKKIQEKKLAMVNQNRTKDQTEEQRTKIKKEIQKSIAKILEKEQKEREVIEEKLNEFQKKRRNNRKSWFGKIIGNVLDFFK